LPDDELLAYSTRYSRILVTANVVGIEGFIHVEAQWKRTGRLHSGILLIPQRRLEVDLWAIRDRLIEVAGGLSAEEMQNTLCWL
jgi:hypothetical protein